MALLLASLIPTVRAGRIAVAAVRGLGSVGRRVLSRMPRLGSAGKNPPAGGRSNLDWKLGTHKSDAKWENQMRERNWTKEKITDTIKNGKEYKAPNDVRRNDPTATATRYEKDGKFVVRDDQTGEILQVSGLGDFRPKGF